MPKGSFKILLIISIMDTSQILDLTSYLIWLESVDFQEENVVRCLAQESHVAVVLIRKSLKKGA